MKQPTPKDIAKLISDYVDCNWREIEGGVAKFDDLAIEIDTLYNVGIDYQDLHRPKQSEEMKEAVSIIETLMQYGNIRPVEGVVYPAGTHSEFLDKAAEWLRVNRPV